MVSRCLLHDLSLHVCLAALQEGLSACCRSVLSLHSLLFWSNWKKSELPHGAIWALVLNLITSWFAFLIHLCYLMVTLEKSWKKIQTCQVTCCIELWRKQTSVEMWLVLVPSHKTVQLRTFALSCALCAHVLASVDLAALLFIEVLLTCWLMLACYC